MSALTATSHQATKSTGAGAPGLLLMGIAALIAAGAMALAIQAGISSKASVTTPAFDAVQFRAEERIDLSPSWNAVQFRAEERQDLSPAFDPVQYRAEERVDLAPSILFDGVKYRADERYLR